MKSLLLLASISLLFFSNDASAYVDNYPPYRFKNGPPKHLEAKSLVDFDKSKYRSKDGRILVKLKETADGFEFILKDRKLILAHIEEDKVPLPNSVYQVDLDGNGKKDFIIFYNYRGSGLESQRDRVEIFLKRREGSYQKISYDTFSAGLEDFVDLDRDARFEVIITSFYRGDKHNYFTYDIYKLKDYGLINADSQFKGFPKFVWITYKKNDKDTMHLTREKRLLHIDRKNNSIQCERVVSE